MGHFPCSRDENPTILRWSHQWDPGPSKYVGAQMEGEEEWVVRINSPSVLPVLPVLPLDPRRIFCFREDSPAVLLGLQRFYNNQRFSDLTVLAPDGSKIFVHQIVLAACSKRLSDVLEQGPRDPRACMY